MHIHLHRLEHPLAESSRTPGRSRVGGVSGPTVAAVTGDLDAATAPEFLRRIDRATRGTVRTLIVDLSRMGFVGIAGVQALADAQDRASCRGVAMLLVPGGGTAVRALEVTGLAHRFHCFPSVRAAVEARRSALAAHLDLEEVVVGVESDGERS